MTLDSALAARPVSTPTTRRRTGEILFLCNGLVPQRDGGMVPSILGFAGGLAAAGRPPRIVTPTRSDLATTPVAPGLTIEGPVADLEAQVAKAGVVHLHGLWQAHTRRGARASRRYRVPYLIAAHGMAEPWAMRHKALRKRVYTALVEGRNLRRASCLHALSRPEIGHLRALAPQTPVAWIPNGVDLAPFRALPHRSVLESEYPELTGKFLLLFYSRLHAKKGLDLLGSALQRLASDHPHVHLLLAGRDDGAWLPFRDRMTAAGLEHRITYLGHVGGQRARAVWGAADAFVLPSYSEGFSMAILEAMAARLPVLMTTACHFPEAHTADAAIVVEPTPDGVTDGLRALLDRNPNERMDLGQRGRSLVESRYTWERQATQLAHTYDWLLGGGPPPDCVDLATR
jgi:glycosyltransferase involved in cell wall biosynthesis